MEKRIAAVTEIQCRFCGVMVLIDMERIEVLHLSPLCAKWSEFAAKNPDSVIGSAEVELPEGTE